MIRINIHVEGQRVTFTAVDGDGKPATDKNGDMVVREMDLPVAPLTLGNLTRSMYQQCRVGNTKVRAARAWHQCTWCTESIQPGTGYEIAKSPAFPPTGGRRKIKLHPECSSFVFGDEMPEQAYRALFAYDIDSLHGVATRGGIVEHWAKVLGQW